MEESVALNKKRQSKFAKKVKKAKERLSGSSNFAKAPVEHKEDSISENERGVVYLGHIPHGFYENEMRSYFKQFGKVTNVRLCRSKSTGRSKGYAFIEFQNAGVAKIAAETMNNYLMFNRRIVAKYMPYDARYKHINRSKSWSLTNYPKKVTRDKVNRIRNQNIKDGDHLKLCRRLLSNVNKTLDKLQSIGINYSFKPEDPEGILLKLQISNKEKTL